MRHRTPEDEHDRHQRIKDGVGDRRLGWHRAAFARKLAVAGHDVVLVARREQRLKELAVEIETAHGVRCDVLAADLADPDAPAAIMRDVEARGRTIDVLVNNAGLSGNTAFADASGDTLGAELFHGVMGTRSTADRFPSFVWSDPEDVVRAGWDAVEAGHPICVPGAVNKVLAAATRPRAGASGPASPPPSAHG